MKHGLTAACIGLALGALPLHADELTITGFNQVRDFGCAGAVVMVDGVNHDLAISETCQSVTVSGAQNKVVFENAASVTLVGASNQAAGVVAGAGGDVTLAGVDNVLTLRFERPARVEISGSGNRLVWSVADGVPRPDIRVSGENNIVAAQ